MRRRGVRADASSVLCRYRYELGNCNDLNLAAWCGRMLVAMARCDGVAFSATVRLGSAKWGAQARRIRGEDLRKEAPFCSPGRFHGRSVARRARGLGIERKELCFMGWWQTASGGVIGDGPANIIDGFDEGWTEPSQIPVAVRAEIAACYREDLGREPSDQEFEELLIFCRDASGDG